MLDYSQKLLYTAISIMISVVLHFMMWMAADHFKLRSFDSQRTVFTRKTNLDVIDMKVVPRPDNNRVPAVDLSDIISQQKEVLKNLFKKEGIVELPQPSHLPRSKDSGRYRINTTPTGGAKSITPLSILPQEFMTIKPKSTSLKRKSKRSGLISQIKPNQKFKLVPDSVPQLKVHSRSIDSRISKSKIQMRIPSKEATVVKTSSTVRDVPELIVITKLKAPKEKMKILDSVLIAKARLYQSPQTKESFFQIEITFDNDKTTERIPKDILFLQDASSSISFSKLKKFKRGIKLGLDYVHKDDKYNIVTFRVRPNPLFPTFVPATEENSLNIKLFLDTISPSGKTDIYAGLAPYVATPRSAPNRPILILLVSDGKTTTGLKLEDRELISRIISENDQGVSIFSFSVGSKANLFLMDFLSYMNRGISLHIEKKDGASELLADYVETLSDIIIADLTYKITGNLQAEIYPKQLPHLFRKHPLTLYGKLTPDTEEVAIQIIGKDKNGNKDELIKRISLNTASPAGPEIMQRWALQKIYHLLGESILENSNEFDKEINQIALKYNIDIPY